MFFLGIFIGILATVAYIKAQTIFDKDCVTHKEYYFYSSEAVGRYNKISNYFNEHRNELQLVSLKLISSYSPLNFSQQDGIIVKYKFIDKNFKVQF